MIKFFNDLANKIFLNCNPPKDPFDSMKKNGEKKLPLSIDPNKYFCKAQKYNNDKKNIKKIMEPKETKEIKTIEGEENLREAIKELKNIIEKNKIQMSYNQFEIFNLTFSSLPKTERQIFKLKSFNKNLIGNKTLENLENTKKRQENKLKTFQNKLDELKIEQKKSENILDLLNQNLEDLE